MARVVWDPVALDDLDEISQYIARQSLPAAKRLVTRLFDRADELERFPLSGGFIDEDHRKIYRQLIQGSYRIIYRVDGDNVFIVAVYHAARLLSPDRIR
jgi:addiction module RelE/StbE family toxin